MTNPTPIRTPTDTEPDELTSEFFSVALQREWGLKTGSNSTSNGSSSQGSYSSSKGRRISEVSNEELLESFKPFNIKDSESKELGLEYHFLDGDYREIRKIGEGGLSNILLIEKGGKKYALKLFKRDSDATLEYIVNEMRITRSLDHPDINKFVASGLTQRVNEQGQTETVPYMALEVVEGMTLKKFLKKHLTQGHNIPIEVSLGILAMVSDVIAYMHLRKIVHRDLKPENLMITEEGDLILLDQGSAALIGPDKYVPFQNNTGAGTIEYFSPEQRKGERVGPSSDLYQIGLIQDQLILGLMELWGRRLRDTQSGKTNSNKYSQVAIDFIDMHRDRRRPYREVLLQEDLSEKLLSDLEEVRKALLEVNPEKRRYRGHPLHALDLCQIYQQIAGSHGYEATKESFRRYWKAFINGELNLLRSRTINPELMGVNQAVEEFKDPVNKIDWTKRMDEQHYELR